MTLAEKTDAMNRECEEFLNSSWDVTGHTPPRNFCSKESPRWLLNEFLEDFKKLNEDDYAALYWETFETELEHGGTGMMYYDVLLTPAIKIVEAVLKALGKWQPEWDA